MRIPVVFATDENYIFYTCVAITSLSKSAAIDTEYDIYILVDEDEPDSVLLSKAEQKYSNIHIQVVRISKDIFKEVVINNKHITKATFYRLILSKLLDIDKCIYLDSDIIVTEDLQELFAENIDEYYVAGCRDIWIDMISEEEREVRRTKTGQLPSMRAYINAGVMLMNLRKINEDGLDKIFMAHLNKDYLFEDQDIINICCYGKIKHLSAKWNIFTVFLSCLDEMRTKGICEQVLGEFRKKRGIIHYATPPIRPWEHFEYYANKEWWYMADEWKEEADYQRIKEKIQEKMKRDHWTYYLQKCKIYQKVVVFGFTYYGRLFCDWLLSNGFQKNLIICDNAPEKRELFYKGLQVIPLEKIKREKAVFINCSQQRSEEVTALLLASGIQREDIVIYTHRKWENYQYLDERYYLDELKDIFYRERGIERQGFKENLLEMQEELLRNPEYQEWYDRYNMGDWILKGKKKC